MCIVNTYMYVYIMQFQSPQLQSVKYIERAVVVNFLGPYLACMRCYY
jgi:hypothetical protein